MAKKRTNFGGALRSQGDKKRRLDSKNSAMPGHKSDDHETEQEDYTSSSNTGSDEEDPDVDDQEDNIDSSESEDDNTHSTVTNAGSPSPLPTANKATSPIKSQSASESGSRSEHYEEDESDGTDSTVTLARSPTPLPAAKKASSSSKVESTSAPDVSSDEETSGSGSGSSDDGKSENNEENKNGNINSNVSKAMPLSPVPQYAIKEETVSSTLRALENSRLPALSRPAFRSMESVDNSLASERGAKGPEICCRCIKYLQWNPDHCCTRPSAQLKCDNCARLNKPCQSIPLHYRAAAQNLIENPRDNDFESRVARLNNDLRVYFRRRGRRRMPDNDNSRAAWSINRNLFRLVNTLRAREFWQLLPAGEEEVEEGFFSGRI